MCVCVCVERWERERTAASCWKTKFIFCLVQPLGYKYKLWSKLFLRCRLGVRTSLGGSGTQIFFYVVRNTERARETEIFFFFKDSPGVIPVASAYMLHFSNIKYIVELCSLAAQYGRSTEILWKVWVPGHPRCTEQVYRNPLKSMGAWSPTMHRTGLQKSFEKYGCLCTYDAQYGRSTEILLWKVWVPVHLRCTVWEVYRNPSLKNMGAWAPTMSGLWFFIQCMMKAK